MNKFVKGAKNLAFALSFVTVTACGNVKKSDLDSLKNDLVKNLGDVNGKIESIDKKIGEVESKISSVNDEVKKNLKIGDFKGKNLGALRGLFGDDIKSFEGVDKVNFNLVFNKNGTEFALNIVDNGGFDLESVTNGAFGTVEKNESFKICRLIGFGERCFVEGSGEKKKLVATKNTTAGKINLGGEELDVDVAGEILGKAKELGVDVKGLFKVEDFKGGKLYDVDLSSFSRSKMEKLIKVIADGVEKNDGYVAEGTSIKFKFKGEACELAVDDK